MMKTATDFAAQVKKCEKAIRAAHGANAELLSTTKATMALPLPQTYEDSNGGAGGAAAVALHQVRAAPARLHSAWGLVGRSAWPGQDARVQACTPGQCGRRRARTASRGTPAHAGRFCAVRGRACAEQ